MIAKYDAGAVPGHDAVKAVAKAELQYGGQDGA